MRNLESGPARPPPSRRGAESSPELITDPEDAREQIHEMFEKGERPVVSVPEEYAEALSKGLVAHSTWIPGFSAIVGTFGRPPYVPNTDSGKRVLVKVELEEDQIEPRFTGPKNAYQGIVVLKGPIPPERIVRLN